MYSFLIDRFELMLKENGISARKFSKETGISQAAITKWRKGTTPNNENLKIISDYFKKPVSFFIKSDKYNSSLDNDFQNNEQNEQIVKIIQNNIIDKLTRKVEDIIGTNFVVKMPDESMVPLINKDDYVYCENAVPVKTNDIVAVRFIDGEITVRKFVRIASGFDLIPENNNYPLSSYQYDQIEKLPRILGVAFNFMRNIYD
ncbi:MAG: LexA family transcriptional regulator [Chloroflexi bacterium]|nr:LexA family transcriptional regulator [Chloroflexota bacterium]